MSLHEYSVVLVFRTAYSLYRRYGVPTMTGVCISSNPVSIVISAAGLLRFAAQIVTCTSLVVSPSFGFPPLPLPSTTPQCSVLYRESLSIHTSTDRRRAAAANLATPQSQACPPRPPSFLTIYLAAERPRQRNLTTPLSFFSPRGETRQNSLQRVPTSKFGAAPPGDSSTKTRTNSLSEAFRGLSCVGGY